MACLGEKLICECSFYYTPHQLISAALGLSTTPTAKMLYVGAIVELPHPLALLCILGSYCLSLCIPTVIALLKPKTYPCLKQSHITLFEGVFEHHYCNNHDHDHQEEGSTS